MKQKANLSIYVSPTSKVMSVEKDTTAIGRVDNTTALIMVCLQVMIDEYVCSYHDDIKKDTKTQTL